MSQLSMNEWTEEELAQHAAWAHDQCYAIATRANLLSEEEAAEYATWFSNSWLAFLTGDDGHENGLVTQHTEMIEDWRSQTNGPAN